MKTSGDLKGKYQLMAEINMIPLIDVALVLLIIFMVITPVLVRAQIKLNLTSANKTEPLPQPMIEVQIDKSGAVSLAGQPVAKSEIENRLRGMVFDPAQQPMVIQADRDVPFQHVVTVMDAAKKIGITKLGVGVKRERDSKPDKKPKP